MSAVHRRLGASVAATLVAGLAVLTSAGHSTQGASIGPVPTPDRVCVQYTSTPDDVVHYFCVNFPGVIPSV